MPPSTSPALPAAPPPCWSGAWCWPRCSPPTTAPATSSGFCFASPPTSATYSVRGQPADGAVGCEVPAAAAPPGPVPQPGGGGTVAGGLAAGDRHRHRHHRALPPPLVSVKLPEQTA